MSLGSLARAMIVVALLAVLPLMASSVLGDQNAAANDERLYYPSGPFLRQASLGFHAPAADYVWLQATQYYGGYHRGEHDLRYFDHLVDAVAVLDPGFVEAYHFASLVYCLDHADFDRALNVLQRGILANPDNWRLHFDMGFMHYVFRHDYAAASHWFSTAAEMPGATDFCQRFAAFARRRAGDAEGSLLLWDNLLRTTDSADMRALAEKMIERCQETLSGAPRDGLIGPPAPTHPTSKLKESS